MERISRALCICVKRFPGNEEFQEDDTFYWTPHWIGNNILVYGRKKSVFPFQMLIGPDWILMLYTYANIIGISAIFIVFVAPRISHGVMWAGAALLCLELILFSMTALSDPGIVLVPAVSSFPPSEDIESAAQVAPPGSRPGVSTDATCEVVEYECRRDSAMDSITDNNMGSTQDNSGDESSLTDAHEIDAPEKAVSPKQVELSQLPSCPSSHSGGGNYRGGMSSCVVTHLSGLQSTAKPQRSRDSLISAGPTAAPTQTPLIECSICNIMRPVAASHCHYCKTCVLQLDHHCGFTGRCIGRRTLEYFRWMIICTQLTVLFGMSATTYMLIADFLVPWMRD